MSFDPRRAGHLISPPEPAVLDVLGPTVELLTMDTGDASAPGLLRGLMLPGTVVPVHAHGEPETFIVLSGQLEALAMAGSDARWVEVDEGQVFHVPPHARHALRNVGTRPAVALTVTTPQMVRFFEQVGTPVEQQPPGQPPSAATLHRFLEVTAERGYWNGTPADNAAVGIDLPAPG